MTLEEYLVKLGWNVDEPSFKRFTAALAATGARAAELSSTVIETAAAIELMVSKVARQYETLYYASQRTGQSVQYIQSTQFAFKQIGLSAEGASASIEHMGSILRTQPWLKAIFGGASTPQEVASRLGKSGLPYFLQARFAEMIGMDETTLLHLQRFADVEASAQANFARRQKEAGLDPEKLAAQSTEFGRELNKLEGDLDIFGDRMAADLIEPMTKLIRLLDEGVQWISRVDAATKGWAGTIGALAGTAGGLLVFEKVLRRVLGLGSKTATGATLGLGAKAAKGLSLGTGGWLGAVIGGLSIVKQDDPELKSKLREKLGPLFYELGLSKSPDLTESGTGAGGKTAFPGVGAAKVTGYGKTANKAQQIVDALVAAGYPVDSARGIAAGLYSESGLNPGNVNPTSGATGIAQWLGTRKTGFKDKFNKDVGDATLEEQLQYVMWELQNTEKATGDKLRKGGMNARESAAAFIHGYERPGPAGEVSDMTRAGPLADALSQLTGQQNASPSNNITVNSKTDVHVNASGPDVASTAKAYGDAHDQANENLVRNVTGVMR